jgi:transmembrane sensor
LNENLYNINDDLLVKYLLGEASAQEKTAVENWLLADEANAKYFGQLQLIWTESEKLADKIQVDENAAWKRFRERTERPRATNKPISTLHKMSWMRIAALLILIVGVSTVAYLILNKNAPVQMITASTSDKVLSDTLPDGSVVTLNKNSSLVYPDKFEKEERPVTLNGEAFFNVTPDKKKPFIIHVNDVTIRVVGTSFNVRSENGRTEVIVETGIVQVMRKGKIVELKPKEKTSIDQQDSALVKETEKEQLYNYYRTKEFVCDNTPLWKLVQVLNEAYHANIIIGRDELKTLPISTTFSNESLDQVLEVIRLTFGIAVQKTQDKIILR